VRKATYFSLRTSFGCWCIRVIC